MILRLALHSILLSIWIHLATSKLLKNHLDWKEGNGETMLYAVKSPVHPLKHSDMLTDMSNHGLVYTSECLYIESCYIFTHVYHFANGSCSFSNTTCAPAVKATKEILHARLDALDYVDWYSEIWERPRYKRRVDFNDKRYMQQWHLVS